MYWHDILDWCSWTPCMEDIWYERVNDRKGMKIKNWTRIGFLLFFIRFLLIRFWYQIIRRMSPLVVILRQNHKIVFREWNGDASIRIGIHNIHMFRFFIQHRRAEEPRQQDRGIEKELRRRTHSYFSVYVHCSIQVYQALIKFDSTWLYQQFIHKHLREIKLK